MSTICASVNPRLLTRANRLFTGRLSGRIIEILQNARRAGATRVEITNRDGVVTVRDDGRGIDDFSTLLDLGGSTWDDSLESSEDPCGVGLFCLAPRQATVRSNGRRDEPPARESSRRHASHEFRPGAPVSWTPALDGSHEELGATGVGRRP